MHHSTILSLTSFALFSLVSAIPQTLPSPTPTPYLSQPLPDSQVHDVVDNIMCEDADSGTTTYYETHDLELEDEDNNVGMDYDADGGGLGDSSSDSGDSAWMVQDFVEQQGVANPGNDDGMNDGPPDQGGTVGDDEDMWYVQRLKKRGASGIYTPTAALTPTPTGAATTMAKTAGKNQKQLKKRGNMCVKSTAEYYSDPPGLDEIIRPAVPNTGGLSSDNHYRNYIPAGGRMSIDDAIAELEEEAENLVAEQSEDGSSDDDSDGGDYGPGDQGYWEGFDADFDEFAGEDAGTRRVIHSGVGPGVHGVGMGRVGGGSLSAVDDVQDMDDDVIPSYQVSSGHRMGIAGSARSHSIIDEDTVAEYQRQDMARSNDRRQRLRDELENEFEMILELLPPQLGDMGDMPRDTEIPLQSFDIGEESDFPDLGTDTMQMIADFNRMEMGNRRGT
ncbi:hypothetical protein H072_10585 [Dactylellina haptotyla CBS 200.50]|uniref:BHLH domain-containing protein n=1 Tax=Dactylellina haptotyla (strain CBS 200.50) TaxID=1284197 RepID=S7ZYX7_DACHA|nr:hypothetical protein H072_10585 [Dactylellina haptotyla CBS 200.50]